MEGLVDIQDKNIKSNPKKIQVRLNEFRRSKNYGNESFSGKFFRELIGVPNNLYGILLVLSLIHI